jgi:hypothetical protein
LFLHLLFTRGTSTSLACSRPCGNFPQGHLLRQAGVYNRTASLRAPSPPTCRSCSRPNSSSSSTCKRPGHRLTRTIEIEGVQHIVHRRPAPANFVLPWRRRLRERYCSQKEKAHCFLLSVRHSQGAFGRACPIRYPSGRPEIRGNHSLRNPSPAGFLLARVGIR